MRRIAVATSGGRDSTALLHCTVRAAAAADVEVLAFHVHHGLQSAADAWLQRVRTQARRWGARFDARSLTGAPAAGESVEAWARAGRYRALTEMAQLHDCTLVLLAQHRRDQAETWMLQALRGGSPAGLAAMPASAVREGITWVRPWLRMPREAIDAYTNRHRLSWVEDPSNQDPRYARNRLRLKVWPALIGAFSDAETALSAAATQAAHAANLAGEVLAMDLPEVVRDGALQVDPWLRLPPARRRNALRGWLGLHLSRSSPESLLQRLMEELPACRVGHWEALDFDLRLFKRELRASPRAASLPSCAQQTAWLQMDRPGIYQLAAWHGSFIVTAADQLGVAPARLRQVQVRPRAGGERFRFAPRSAARSLKQQFQSRSIPTWQRNGPLLFDTEGRLIFVPGLGLDATLLAPPGEPQYRVVWLPNEAGIDGSDRAASDA